MGGALSVDVMISPDSVDFNICSGYDTIKICFVLRRRMLYHLCLARQSLWRPII